MDLVLLIHSAKLQVLIRDFNSFTLKGVTGIDLLFQFHSLFSYVLYFCSSFPLLLTSLVCVSVFCTRASVATYFVAFSFPFMHVAQIFSLWLLLQLYEAFYFIFLIF